MEEKNVTTASKETSAAKKDDAKKTKTATKTISKKAAKKQAIYIKKDKKEVIWKFKKHDKDTWSTRVQVAILTDRINSLTEHLKIHKKDKHSRFGLIKLTWQRRKLLTYIHRKKPEEYTEIISELWLRR